MHRNADSVNRCVDCCTRDGQSLSDLKSRWSWSFAGRCRHRGWSELARAHVSPQTPTIELPPTTSSRVPPRASRSMINAFLVFNGSGQPRLTKFYTQLVPLPPALGQRALRLTVP